jgi:S1/P1 Nuclease
MAKEMHITSVKNILILLIIALYAPNALAWGRLGHETVAEVATYLIRGSHAEMKLKALLKGEETLVTASVWADCAKGFQYCHAEPTPEMERFVKQNPKHHHYHYADVPFQSKHYEGQGAGAQPDDVVHVLKDAIQTLRTGTAPAGRSWTQREALFLVVHLVGDIHQPLHVGAGYIDDQLHFVIPNNNAEAETMNTAGGNLLCYRTKPLHAAWDDDFVVHAMRKKGVKTPYEFSKGLILSAEKSVAPSSKPEDWVEAWADESLQLSSQALKRVSVISVRQAGSGRFVCGKTGDAEAPRSHPSQPEPKKVWDITLPEDYPEQASHEVTHRLAQAGGRLALVLKAIWP